MYIRMYSSVVVLLVASCGVMLGAAAVPIVDGVVRITIVYGNKAVDTFVTDISEESVLDLKAAVFHNLGIPIEEQTLVFDSDAMQNNKDLYDYGVQKKENPVFFLAKSEDQIAERKIQMLTVVQGNASYYIDTPDAENTTILEIKNILSKKTGWNATEILIEFNGWNVSGDSTTTLKSFGIDEKKWPVLLISRKEHLKGVSNTEDKGLFWMNMQHGDEHSVTYVSSGVPIQVIRMQIEKNLELFNAVLTFRNEELLDEKTLLDYGMSESYLHVINVSEK